MASSRMRVDVIGAGPSGLAAAYGLVGSGIDPTVLERSDRVGGLATSIRFRDCTLDLGPHFFASGTVDQLWRDVLGAEVASLSRRTSLCWHGRRFAYPPRPLGILGDLGLVETTRVVLSALSTRIRRRPVRTYRDRLVATFGERLVGMCFAPYIEKLWGVPCDDIHPDWQAGRLRDVSVRRLLGRLRTSGADESFEHPAHGAGYLYERIAANVTARGGTIRLAHSVRCLRYDGSRITTVEVEDADGAIEVRAPDEVISTMPLGVLVRSLHPAPPKTVLDAARRLHFRNTVLVYLVVERDELFDEQCLYVNDAGFSIGRITNFANWSPAMTPGGITPLCCELWCDSNHATWSTSDDALIAQTTDEVRRIGILRDERVTDALVLRIPNTHPMYAADVHETRATIQGFLSTLENLSVIGRGGAFLYEDQDRTILQGLDAARRIVDRMPMGDDRAMPRPQQAATAGGSAS